MTLLSFNKVKQDELVRKSHQARQRRRYREAYDFLREALRYGEDAAILSRAAGLLNEMGEYDAALQVAVLAVGKERNCAPAQWEMAVALERRWDLDEAVEILNGLDEAVYPDVHRLLCVCHLKKGNVAAARRSLFRMSHSAGLPLEWKLRCDRFEQLGKDRLSLRDWKWVMHHHLLVHERGEDGFVFHRPPDGGQPDASEGGHYVIGHPSFTDCARVLASLEEFLAEHTGRYAGVVPLGESARPVALFLARLFELPLIGPARMGSSRLLLVMGTNRDRVQTPGGSFLKHDLLIFMKSFECEEFHDVVSPPHGRAHLGRWVQPMRPARLQIIGGIGEWIALPWERPDRKPDRGARQRAEPVWGDFSGEDAMDPQEATDLLWSSHRRLRKGGEAVR